MNAVVVSAVQSIMVYLSLSCVMVWLSSIKRDGKIQYTPILIALLLYSIIMGVRYGVGIDHLTYKYIYEECLLQGDIFSLPHLEPGFQFLVKQISSLGLHYSFFFTIIAFLQIFFVFYSINETPSIYPYLAYTFMFSCVWFSYANGMRQQLAFCIFSYSMVCLFHKKIFWHYLFILLAVSIHKSAIILVIFYPIFMLKKEWIKNIKLQYLLLAGSLVLMTMNIVFDVIGVVEKYLVAADFYSGYMDTTDKSKLEFLSRDTGFGVGFVLMLAINICIIYYSNEVKEQFKGTWVSLIYDLYFLGMLWNYVFIQSLMFNRVAYYFYGFNFIIGAYTLYFLHQKKRKQFWGVAGLYALVFLGNLSHVGSGNITYIFFWQDYLYLLKP